VRTPPAESRLHVLELARVVHGLVAHAQGGQHLIDRGDAVAGVGVVAQELRRALAALRLEGLEEVRHVARVVARVGHDARAFEVGLRLGGATEA
jgi:hypothetical protein